MVSGPLQDIPKTRQYIISVVSIVVVTLLSLAWHDIFGYRVVAFMLLEVELSKSYNLLI